MSTQEDILVGATPVIAFALGGIWGWLRAIHRVLLEIKHQLILTEMKSNMTLHRTDDTLQIIKDRIR